VLGQRRPLEGFQRSARLIRGHWIKVATLTIVLGLIAVVLGPLVGTALILSTSLPLWILNIVAGVVYVLTMPYVALATGYVYFDMRVREQLEDRTQPTVVPPEIELGYG
jgi:pilus assembly protein TadC